jgi:hypothetical protein
MSKTGRGAPITSSNKESLKEKGEDGALYKSLKLLLGDERGFRQLCMIDENGVYRDILEMRLRQWIRPLTRKDAHDYITNLIGLGVFDTVIETMEKAIPVEQLRRKGRRRKQPSKVVLEAIERFESQFRALIPEDIEVPRNCQLVGFTRIGLAVYAIVKFWKVKLVPSRVLREVCCKEFYVCESS